MAKKEKKEKKEKDKTAKPSKQKGDSDAQAKMMGMPGSMPGVVPPQTAMIKGMPPMVVASSRGGKMVRPMSMPGAAALQLQQAALPGFGRGARRSQPMSRGGAAPGRGTGRPQAAPAADDGHASDSSSSSSSSSSSGPPPAASSPSALVIGGGTLPAPVASTAAASPRAAPTAPLQQALAPAPAPAAPQSPSAVSPTAGGPQARLSAEFAIDVPVPAPATAAPETPPEAPGVQEPQAATNSPQEEPVEEELFTKLKPRPKMGKISFNVQGAQNAMAAAQAKVQVQVAMEAARAKRMNVRDASTQTVRDPERQDGEIVTIWRLRPRGMESFPHYAKPKKEKRKAREALMCALGE
ncbi:unnamed protein product, partial [Polarella glacialis]